MQISIRGWRGPRGPGQPRQPSRPGRPWPCLPSLFLGEVIDTSAVPKEYTPLAMWCRRATPAAALGVLATLATLVALAALATPASAQFAPLSPFQSAAQRNLLILLQSIQVCPAYRHSARVRIASSSSKSEISRNLAKPPTSQKMKSTDIGILRAIYLRSLSAMALILKLQRF